MDKDLFGNEIVEDVLLRDKFMEPPFSVLNAGGGEWHDRKQKWLQKGIRSEIGRDAVCLAQGLNKFDPRKSYTGKSIFDSALTELMYNWFCPDNGSILDPFAGGSVRGIIANYLGYNYTGIELRQEQVDSNIEQSEAIIPLKKPLWICGDSDKELDILTDIYDFIFTCPPYVNLEVYSNLPDDLSNMNYSDFMIKYKSIIEKSTKHLKKDCFACIVVGEVRDKQGYYYDFVGETKRIFMGAGLKFYNDMILIESGLNTAAMRADKQFTSGKKVVKIHQNILVFRK